MQDPQQLRFTTTTRGGARTVAVEGEVDASNATEFERALGEALTAAERVVLIDLSGVEYLGSEGIRGLVKVHRSAVDRGVEWHVSASSIAGRALEVAGLEAWLVP